MSDVYVSCGVRQVSASEEPLESLFIAGVEVMLREFEKAHPGRELDAVVLTSAHPVELNDVTPDEICDAVSEYLKAKGTELQVHYFHKPGIYNDEANLSASAAGAALLHEGIRMIAFDNPGYHTIGLVAAEQMRTAGREQSIDALRSLIHPEERKYGVTMPALAALLTKMAITSEPGLEQTLKETAAEFHTKGTENPRAHIRKGFTVEDYDGEASEGGKNQTVSSPLRLWDVAPRSAGYAALVVSDSAPEEDVKVKVAGYGQGIDKIAISRRDLSKGSASTLKAMEQLRAMIDSDTLSIPYAELHDAFPIVAHTAKKDTGLSDAAINLSGGISCGHALAASGLGQVVELMKQAKGEAEVRLDNLHYPHFSLALSVGGFNTYNFVTLLYASRDDTRSFSLKEIPEITKDDFDTSFPTLPEEFAAEVISRTTLEYPPSGFGSRLTIALCLCPATGERFLALSPDDEISIGQPVRVKRNADGLYTAA